MSFRSFTRAPFWSRLFKVVMVLWYIVVTIILVVLFVERPSEVTYRPADLSQWSFQGKLGYAVVAYEWLWVPVLLLVAPWLFLLVLRLLRNTAEYLVAGSEGGK